MAPKKRKLGKLKSTTKGPQLKCARDSTRVVMPPGRPDVRIIVCCPPGQWMKSKKRCKVALRKHAKKKYAKR